MRVVLETNRGAVEISHGQLATAVGWPANTAFGVANAPEELPLDAIGQNVEGLIAQAQQNRPDLAAVRAFVQQKEAQLRQTTAALWPQLVANGNAGHEKVWAHSPPKTLSLPQELSCRFLSFRVLPYSMPYVGLGPS